MPITFNCPCGKSLRVADEHAGRRVKCPACQTAGTVPKEQPKFEVVEDEPEERPAPAKAKPVAKAATKPAAREDDGGDGFTVEEDEEKPKTKKKPTFSKGARRDTREDDEDEEEERPKKRKKKKGSSDPDAGKKIMYLVGGVVLALAGVAIAFFWWQNGPHTGRRPYSGLILGICLVVVGIGTAVKGITGNFDDE